MKKGRFATKANLPKHYGSLLSHIAQGKNPVAKLAQKARQMSKTSAWLLTSSIPSNARNGELTANGAVRRLSNNLQLFLINTLGLIIPSFARFLAFIFFLKLNHSKIFSLFLQKTQRVVKFSYSVSKELFHYENSFLKKKCSIVREKGRFSPLPTKLMLPPSQLLP